MMLCLVRLDVDSWQIRFSVLEESFLELLQDAARGSCWRGEKD